MAAWSGQASVKAVQAMLQETARENPKAKEAKAESFLDQRIMKGLEDSGFIKQVYGE
ncbi:MAG: hypothetical protein HY675_29380 [Chloroflexi bacterium]|nr:hypothetical protein [Chloroflexota bacterium]